MAPRHLGSAGTTSRAPPYPPPAHLVSLGRTHNFLLTAASKALDKATKQNTRAAHNIRKARAVYDQMRYLETPAYSPCPYTPLDPDADGHDSDHAGGAGMASTPQGGPQGLTPLDPTSPAGLQPLPLPLDTDADGHDSDHAGGAGMASTPQGGPTYPSWSLRDHPLPLPMRCFGPFMPDRCCEASSSQTTPVMPDPKDADVTKCSDLLENKEDDDERTEPGWGC